MNVGKEVVYAKEEQKKRIEYVLPADDEGEECFRCVYFLYVYTYRLVRVFLSIS